MQGNPESFHEQATPFLEDHLQAQYGKGAGAAAAAESTSVLGLKQKPITLRGSGSVQAEAPASAVELFVVAFKRWISTTFLCA